MEQTTNEVKRPGAGGSRKRRGRSGIGGSAPFIALGLTAAILAGAYLGLCAYANSQNVFYGNYAINGVDVGGMSVEQAGEALASALPAQTISISSSQNPADEGWTNAPSASVTLGELGYTAEQCPGIAQARFQHQQSGGFFSRGAQYLSAMTSSRRNNVTLEERDEAVFQQGVAKLAQDLSLAPQEGSHSVDGDMLSITKSANGRSVQTNVLTKALEDAILKTETEAKVNFDQEKAPQITAQAVHDEMAGEMKNAGYDAATGSIIPEQVGADFDVAQAQKLLNEAGPGETITIQADIQKPEVTAEVLKKVLFRDLLGEYTTHVSGSAARINNVKLASAAFNGTVLNSGDVFSYNGVVGQRTTAKGYKGAPAYVNGDTVNEIGGGVCQPSSTLYYACLLANMEITERYAHRYIPAYITRGMDATVSWGGPDYKFTNNTAYPVKVVASYANNYLTVQLYGTKTNDVTVKMTYETLSTTPFKVITKEDPSLAAGKQSVQVTPYTGYKVRTYRNLYDGSGKLISSEFEANSDYKSRDKVVLVGASASEPASSNTTAPAETPTTTPVTPPAEQTPTPAPVNPPAEQTPTPNPEPTPTPEPAPAPEPVPEPDPTPEDFTPVIVIPPAEE